MERVDALLKRSEMGMPDMPQVLRVPCAWVEGETVRPLSS